MCVVSFPKSKHNKTLQRITGYKLDGHTCQELDVHKPREWQPLGSVAYMTSLVHSEQLAFPTQAAWPALEGRNEETELGNAKRQNENHKTTIVVWE